MRLAAALGLAAALALTAPASAQIEPFLSGNVVKIGVLTDMSSLYADIGGPGCRSRRREWRSPISAAP
jgi:branched-chain amino acid transport system substrate-binding protein